jgi:hypothetical protein
MILVPNLLIVGGTEVSFKVSGNNLVPLLVVVKSASMLMIAASLLSNLGWMLALIVSLMISG